MSRPTSFIAGDTVVWTEEGGDYPAPAYKRKAVFSGPSGTTKITVTGVASGTDFTMTLAKANSDVAAGEYDLVVYAEDNIETPTLRYTIASSRVTVQPNYSKTGVDGRSHVRKVLEALEATIEGRATKQHEALTIAGRSITLLKPAELRHEWLRYKRLYAQELAAQKIAQGEEAGNRILTRFTNPG